MGVVPQLDNLDIALTVEQTLLMFAYLYGVKGSRRKDAIERAWRSATSPTAATRAWTSSAAACAGGC